MIMSKRFTRNIRLIEDIDKQPKSTNEQNDLLSDKKDVYVRNQNKYEKITGGVHQVNNKTPDDQGNVEIDTGVHKVNGKDPDEQGNIEVDTGVMQVNGKDPDEQGNIEVDINDRNLLTGTSDEWEERTFSSWTKGYIYLYLKDSDLEPGDIFTYGVDIDNTIDEVNTDEVKNSITFRDSEDNRLGIVKTNYISGGKKERTVCTAEIPEKTSVIRIGKFSKGEGGKQKTFAIRKIMLNHGNRAAPWTPAPEDIVTNSELEKIKQAIINLGGSI